jgi:hypothetical protein
MVRPVANIRLPASGPRLTPIGRFNVTEPGTVRKRAVPVPWVDCAACAWRHYPSTDLGLWYIATTCVSCGAELEAPERPEAARA